MLADGSSFIYSYNPDCASVSADMRYAEAGGCFAAIYDTGADKNGKSYGGENGKGSIGVFNATIENELDCGTFEYRQTSTTADLIFNLGGDSASEECRTLLTNECLAKIYWVPSYTSSFSEAHAACNNLTNYTIHHCLAKGTMITLADGSKKAIEDLDYNDELLCWNFDEGAYTTAKPSWLMKNKIVGTVVTLKISNGQKFTASKHRIFAKEEGKFVYNTDVEIGTTTLLENGEEVQVVSKLVEKKPVEVYNVMTEYHFNVFADGVLTSNRFSNVYPIKDYKFIKDDRELVPYDEYSDVPYEWYEKLRLAEQPLDINRDGADAIAESVASHVNDFYIKTNKRPVEMPSREQELALV